MTEVGDKTDDFEWERCELGDFGKADRSWNGVGVGNSDNEGEGCEKSMREYEEQEI